MFYPSVAISTLLVGLSNVSNSTDTEMQGSYVYDYILTFSDEQRLVWPAKRSLIKFIFYLNRYIPLLASVVGMYGMIYM